MATLFLIFVVYILMFLLIVRLKLEKLQNPNNHQHEKDGRQKTIDIRLTVIDHYLVMITIHHLPWSGAGVGVGMLTGT